MDVEFSRGDRGVIALLVALMFVAGADLLVINPTLPQMARDLEVEVEVGSLWVTAYALATAGLALVFGPISDRFGRRPVLLWGMLVLAAGTTACGLAQSFEGLFAARALAGAGAGMLVTSNTSYVGDHFEPRERAIAMGWVMSGFFLSLILAVPLGAFLADRFGWRIMFVVIGAAAAGLWLTMLALLPRPRFEQRTEVIDPSSVVRGYGRLLADRRVLGVLLQSLTVGAAMTLFSVYTSPWLEARYGMGTLARGLVYTVGGPALLIGGPMSGRLANALGSVRVVIRASLTMALLLLLMPFSDVFADGRAVTFEHLGIAAPTLFVFFGAMACGSIRAGPFFTLAMDVVESDQRGSLSAIRNTFNHLGGAIGASLGAVLWTWAPSPYLAVCGAAALFTLLGVAALRWLIGVEPRASSAEAPRAPAPAAAASVPTR